MDKENVADGGSVESQTGEMAAEVPMEGQQSALPPVLVETDVTVSNREMIESFADTVRQTALQYMNDPSMLAAAVAVKRKLEKVTPSRRPMSSSKGPL